MAAIDGIVLAAGRSTRMQRSKALLDADGRTFLERAIGSLREAGCRTVFAVVAAGDEAAASCAVAAGGIVVYNPDPRSEPVDSVRLGLRASGDADAVVILPVDVPLVRADTVRELMGAFDERQPPYAVPVAGGDTGHPLVLSRTLFDDVLARTLPEGLHTMLAEHESRALRVEVEDAAVHDDIDTPAEYERRFQRSGGDGSAAHER